MAAASPRLLVGFWEYPSNANYLPRVETAGEQHADGTEDPPTFTEAAGAFGNAPNYGYGTTPGDGPTGQQYPVPRFLDDIFPQVPIVFIPTPSEINATLSETGQPSQWTVSWNYNPDDPVAQNILDVAVEGAVTMWALSFPDDPVDASDLAGFMGGQALAHTGDLISSAVAFVQGTVKFPEYQRRGCSGLVVRRRIRDNPDGSSLLELECEDWQYVLDRWKYRWAGSYSREAPASEATEGEDEEDATPIQEEDVMGFVSDGKGLPEGYASQSRSQRVQQIWYRMCWLNSDFPLSLDDERGATLGGRWLIRIYFTRAALDLMDANTREFDFDTTGQPSFGQMVRDFAAHEGLNVYTTMPLIVFDAPSVDESGSYITFSRATNAVSCELDTLMPDATVISVPHEDAELDHEFRLDGDTATIRKFGSYEKSIVSTAPKQLVPRDGYTTERSRAEIDEHLYQQAAEEFVRSQAVQAGVVDLHWQPGAQFGVDFRLGSVARVVVSGRMSKPMIILEVGISSAQDDQFLFRVGLGEVSDIAPQLHSMYFNPRVEMSDPWLALGRG